MCIKKSYSHVVIEMQSIDIIITVYCLDVLIKILFY